MKAILVASVLVFTTGPVQAQSTVDTLRVLAYNIHHGAGMDERLDLDRVAALIERFDPHVVALQEVDSVVERTEYVDQAAVLGRLTGMQAIFGPFMAYQGGQYGMAVLSRLPVVRSRNLRLPDGEEPRSALAVRVQLPGTGRELEFVGIHFYRTEEERLAQARALADAYAVSDPAPVILAGDFNSRPGSPVLEFLATWWSFVDKGRDRFTFPSMEPAREIDFFALRPADGFTIVSQQLIDEPVISDHRPLFIELVVR